LNRGDYDKRSPLHVAACSNQLEVVIYLVNSGVQINALDRWGCTPLDDATDPQVIKFLMKNGANRVQKLQDKLVIPPTSVSDDEFRLFYAAFENNVLLLQTLNILGCKVNSYDYDGRTALGIAASEGHLEAVSYLVAHGADITHKDIRNNNAIEDARREGRKEVEAFLEEKLKQLT
jgi:ankyrin repeat protein